MALVSNTIQFSRGSIGDLNFYKDHLGRCIARQKAPKRTRFFDNPNGTRQVDTASEFSVNSRFASKIRQTTNYFISHCSDASYYNRLIALLTKSTEADYLSESGKRRAIRGNIHMLEGFEFNKNRHLCQALHADYHTTINEDTGEIRVDIDSLRPHIDIRGPQNAHYFQIIAIATNASPEVQESNQEVTDLLPFTKEKTGPITLRFTHKSNKGEVLLLRLGVLFYEEYQEVPYLIRDGALSIIEVRKLVKETPKYNPETGERINDNGYPVSREIVKKNWEHKLELKYKLKLVSGQNNKAPAGQIRDKQTRLHYLYERQLLDRYRKG